MATTDAAHESTKSASSQAVRKHLQFGWWSLLVFLTLGIVLEGLHGFKVGWYLDASSETRRLLWTLAHAHGTLFAIIQIAFATTVSLVPHWTTTSRTFASHCIISAAILIPSGFFLGGLFVYEADAGLGILLVPAGALLLLVGVFLTAFGVRSRAKSDAGTIDASDESQTEQND